ncbi:MAG: Holliday junction resolvase-like protein [Candidatus Woesearchaeota archaeon]
MELITILVAVLLIAGIAFYIGKFIGTIQKHREWEKYILPKRLKASRAIIGGQVSEQLAPFLPNFPFKPSECVFVGKPTDFIVFHGADEKCITKITFVEVKSGKSRLSQQEKHLREAIDAKNVEYFEWRIE